jgi:hypothetical protein
MKANESGVTKEKEKADAHQRAWDAQYADKVRARVRVRVRVWVWVRALG